MTNIIFMSYFDEVSLAERYLFHQILIRYPVSSVQPSPLHMQGLTQRLRMWTGLYRGTSIAQEGCKECLLTTLELFSRDRSMSSLM